MKNEDEDVTDWDRMQPVAEGVFGCFIVLFAILGVVIVAASVIAVVSWVVG